MSVIDDKGASIYEQLGLNRQQEPRKKSDELGQGDFLKLMTTQLQSQDPFHPMENAEFVVQMAQFSQVTGLQELQRSFSEFAASMQSSQALQASTLVGRKVLVPSDVGALSAGSPMEGATELSGGAGEVAVNIFGPSGELVRRLPMGIQEPGMVRFSWDGLSDTGEPVPPGRYRFSAELDDGGERLALDTFVQAGVDSVTIGNGGQGVTLNLDGIGSRDFASVRQFL